MISTTYGRLLTDRNEFRRAGANGSDFFNAYDAPSHKYFKLFFYFNNENSEGLGGPSTSAGLLAPTWMQDPSNKTTEIKDEKQRIKFLQNHSSAWSYLQLNDDPYRANLLKKFINLLSNISSNSPWYFSELVGLDTAMDRKMLNLENFSISNDRPKISIKCLPDAVDDRIGTLIDLYRNVAWDWVTKREILPANLRKFDMGVLIFDTPVEDLHVKYNFTDPNSGEQIDIPKYVGMADFQSIMPYRTYSNKASYKYIELHNCEFDYNSSRTQYMTLNNKEGLPVEYSLDIYFDDCYESRYNDFLKAEFGDFLGILTDDRFKPKYGNDIFASYQVNLPYKQGLQTVPGSDTKIKDATFTESNKKFYKNYAKDPTITLKRLSRKDADIFPDVFDRPWPTARLHAPFWNEYGIPFEFIARTAVNALIPETGLIDEGIPFIKKALLGNLYTFSLTDVEGTVRKMLKGDVQGVKKDNERYQNILNKYDVDSSWDIMTDPRNAFDKTKEETQYNPWGNYNPSTTWAKESPNGRPEGEEAKLGQGSSTNITTGYSVENTHELNKRNLFNEPNKQNPPTETDTTGLWEKQVALESDQSNKLPNIIKQKRTLPGITPRITKVGQMAKGKTLADI